MWSRKAGGGWQSMDPDENSLWLEGRMGDTLKLMASQAEREVAKAEAGLAQLNSQKTSPLQTPLQTNSSPTASPLNTAAGAVHGEQSNTGNRHQDRSDPRPSSRSEKGKGARVLKDKKRKKISTPTEHLIPSHNVRSVCEPADASVPIVSAVKQDAPPLPEKKRRKKIAPPTEHRGPSPNVRKVSERKGTMKIHRDANVPVITVEQDAPPPPENKSEKIAPPTQHQGPSASVSKVSESKGEKEIHSAPKDHPSKVQPTETGARNTPSKHVRFQLSESSESSESSVSSEGKTPVEDQSKFPEVDWTFQITRRSDDASSDSEDSVSSESADEGKFKSVQSTKSPSPVARKKAVSRASSLPIDAPPEDIFDWKVLGLSGPWSPEPPSNLLSESSWPHLKTHHSLPPCRFQTINEYRATFEGLIFEECKAGLNSAWETLQAPVVETQKDFDWMLGVPEDRGENDLWNFTLLYPSQKDPFNYVEATLCTNFQGSGKNVDSCELLLLSYNDTKLLAIVNYQHYENKPHILLRVRGDLPVPCGQCVLLRLENMVALKRQYVSLSNASEISYPLRQQLLDPQENSNFVISPPNQSCVEENVKVTSRIKCVLKWKKKKLLNNKQLVVVEALLQLNRGFLLVQGPPGTGKTSTIVGMISAMRIEQPRARILVCATSNAAVDELVSRLMHRMLDEAGNFYAPERGTLLRLGVRASIQPACRPVSMDVIRQGNIDTMACSSANARRETLAAASIICTTICGSGNQVFDECDQKFDLLIIDEAAQALESEVLIALQRVTDRCVLVGDPCQLPAVVIQKPGVAYGRSLFERMQEAGRPVFRMTTQYRMHPQISKFPSAQFYGGHLKDSPKARSMLPIFVQEAQETGIDVFGFNLKLGAYCFIDVIWGQEQGELLGHSLANVHEAAVVAAVVQGVVRSLKEGMPTNIGVITPYLAQRAVITRSLEGHGLDEDACEVNTVDGFQGREKDVIILSCVRAHAEYGLGFVSDVRRMNVALTRAKHSLIIVGHARTLQGQSEAWNALIEDASARDSYQLLRVHPNRVPAQKMGNSHTGIFRHSNQGKFKRGAATTARGPKSFREPKEES